MWKVQYILHILGLFNILFQVQTSNILILVCDKILSRDQNVEA